VVRFSTVLNISGTVLTFTGSVLKFRDTVLNVHWFGDDQYLVLFGQ